MKLGIFEDEYYQNLFPLTLTRPAYELRIGALSLRDRIVKELSNFDDILLFGREYLKEVQEERINVCMNDLLKVDDDVLLINGLVLADKKLMRSLQKISRPGIAILHEGRVVAALLKMEHFQNLDLQRSLTSATNVNDAIIRLSSEKLQADDVYMVKYPWELIELNSKILSNDIRSMVDRDRIVSIDPSVKVYGDIRDVYVEDGALIEAGTILDTKPGPIYIKRNTYIQSPSRISGPAYIEEDCTIFGAQIRSGCSIGRMCRIGGEVEESIFHGYSNKRHYGYIGHSYIGEWVNIGAGTTCSNLKNTYGTIKMEIGGRRLDSGSMFLGMFVGDHVKTSIGTYIFSGKRIGTSSHLYGVITEDVPSFTIYARSLGSKPTTLFLESAIDTARRMMERRNVNLSRAYERMLRYIFELTRSERQEKGVVEERLSL